MRKKLQGDRKGERKVTERRQEMKRRRKKDA